MFLNLRCAPVWNMIGIVTCVSPTGARVTKSTKLSQITPLELTGLLGIPNHTTCALETHLRLANWKSYILTSKLDAWIDRTYAHL